MTDEMAYLEHCWLWKNGWAGSVGGTRAAPDGTLLAGYMDGGPEQAQECRLLRGAETCAVHSLDRPHIPGTDYYDGRDGDIEAEDDDEDRIAAEDAAREEMHELVEWQRSLKGW